MTLADQIYAYGKARGLAEALLLLLVSRAFRPSAEQRKLLESCTDHAQLDRWLGRVIAAETAAEVFAD